MGHPGLIGTGNRRDDFQYFPILCCDSMPVMVEVMIAVTQQQPNRLIQMFRRDEGFLGMSDIQDKFLTERLNKVRMAVRQP